MARHSQRGGAETSRPPRVRPGGWLPVAREAPQREPLADWPNLPPVVIFSGCRWNSTGGAQRPVQLARAVVQLGRPVLYVQNMESTRVRDGVVILNTRDFLGDTVERLAAGPPGVVFCGFPCMFDLSEPLSHWPRVTDYCDDWPEFLKAGILSPDSYRPEEIHRAVTESDVVTCSASSLLELVREEGAAHPVLLPNAGPERPFPIGDAPAGFVRGDLTCVFCGCTWGPWLDWDCLVDLAHEIRGDGGVINIVGGNEENSGRRQPQEPNIVYHGARPYPEAMRFVAAADVGLIPFRHEGICRAVDPVKYYDHVACSIPTVATTVLPEIGGRPGVTLAEPGEAFAQAVREAAAAGPLDGETVEEYCRENSWRRRAEEILRLVELGSSGA